MAIAPGSEIAIIHRDEAALMGLTVAAARNGFAVTATESPHPLPAAVRAASSHPAAMIVALTDGDRDDEVEELCGPNTGTNLLFLTSDSRQGRRIAGFVRALGHASLPEDAPTAVIIATLITLGARAGMAT